MKNKKIIIMLVLLMTAVLVNAQQHNPESDFTVIHNDDGCSVIITDIQAQDR
jgi:hypothetical protein